MASSTSSDPSVRIAMTASPADSLRLKQAALDVGAPAAVVARALVIHGLDHLADPAVAATLEAAAQAERRRRSEAARAGGRKGGGSNKKAVS